MSLSIPQSALDSLVCDSCHKYLSVTPVKVFPNRKIKCGRCVSEEDDCGIISLYNKVAQKSIFKCINHYEGCKALLYTSEVLEHEQTCKSKKYECPNCKEEIPSYFIYKHFTSKHKELVLRKTYFVINESDMFAHFLYCYKDYLIFVKYSSHKEPLSNCTNALFKFSILDSKTAETLKVNVVISSGKIIKEKKMDCDIFPLDAGNDFKIELDLTQNKSIVAFSLEEPKSNVTVKTVVSTENVEMPKVTLAMNEEVSDLKSDLSAKLLNLYFKIRNKWYYSTPTVTANLYNSKNENICQVKTDDIVLTCFMCSLSYLSNNNYYYVAYECKKYYYICFMCQKAQDWPCNFLVENHSNYLCKWECGTGLYLHDLQTHEINCKNQIPQQCPEEVCEHSCKLFEMTQHFKLHHRNLGIPVFHNSRHGERLSLKPSTSPIKITYIVSHIYISIELIWDNHLWKISLTSKILNAAPRMIIFKNNEFITLIKGNGSCPHFDEINYKCYLADPKKEEYEKSIIINPL